VIRRGIDVATSKFVPVCRAHPNSYRATGKAGTDRHFPDELVRSGNAEDALTPVAEARRRISNYHSYAADWV